MMSVSVSNKHYTTWKMLCTVFPRSLLLYQKCHSFDTLRPHFPRRVYNLCCRRMEVVWGARVGHMRARGEGASLPTAMVQFCVIFSAPFHLRAHFWVPHLNFLALLGVRVSKDTLPGPKRLTKQGHPKTVFCKVFFSEKQTKTRILLLEDSSAKQFKMTVPFI